MGRAWEVARNLRRRLAVIDRAATWSETWAGMSRNPVIIYSMGKTGTTSLTNAIEQASRQPVLKAHALRPSAIRVRRRDERVMADRPRFWWQAEAMSAYLATHRHRLRMITVVRDPIARAVSAHFYTAKRAGLPALHENSSSMVEQLALWHAAHDWFVEEFRPTTGLDVYASGFPDSDGVMRLSNDRFDVLVLRTEDLGSVGPDVLSRWLGLDRPLALPRSNRGDTESRSEYRSFLDQWTPRPSVLERVYSAPLAKHFYSDAERAGLRDHWLQRS